MKNIFFILFFIFLGLFNYTFALTEYETQITGTIQIGDGAGEIGYNANGLPGDGPLTAKYFTIGPNNKIYIFDKLDGKIQIYTIDLVFIKEFPIRKYKVMSVWHMKVDEQENLIIVDNFGLKKISYNGEMIYELNNTQLPDEVLYNENYFPQGEYVFFTDDKKNIQCISPGGKFLNDQEISDVINQLNQNNSSSSNKNSTLNTKLSSEITNFQNNNRVLFLNNMIQSTNDVLVINNYYKQLNNNTMFKNTIQTEYELPQYTSQYLFIGNDSDRNTYWKRSVEEGIFVFNIYGQLIAMFKKYNNKQTAVSPIGDVYFWEVTPEGITFYKITRRW